MSEHAEAIDYDLITRTNYQLKDIGGALSWSSLDSFLKHLPGDSALARELGKATGWETQIKTNAILADIYDLLQVLNVNLVAIGSHGKQRRKITPYPRPGREKKERALGRDGLPKNELLAWIEEKRRKKVETDG